MIRGLATARPSRVALWLAGAFVLCCVYFPGPGGDWYQEARVDLALAVTSHGTIAIDAYQRNTEDKSYYAGHYYSITAPGLSFASVPIVALMEHASSGRSALSSSTKKTSFSFWVVKAVSTLYTVTLPGVLLLLLFFWFTGYFSSSVKNRAIVTGALGLATDVFPYSQVFYAHVPAALLAFIGFVLVFMLSHGARGRRSEWLIRRPALTCFLAGFALGAAIAFEYQTLVIGLLTGIYALMSLRRRLILFIVLGALPSAGLLLGYNFAAYHNPLVTGYSGYSVAYGHAYAAGNAGLRFPPPASALWGTSFSPYRGLFFISPFLLIAFPGLLLWGREGRRGWIFFLVLPLAYFLVMAAYPIWWGGISVGPRFLTPVLPYFVLPVLFVLDRTGAQTLRFGVYALVIASLVNVWIQTIAGTGYPVASYRNPLVEYSLPALLHKGIRASLGSVVVAPFAGPYSPLGLIPLAVILALWSALVFRPRRGGRMERVDLMSSA